MPGIIHQRGRGFFLLDGDFSFFYETFVFIFVVFLRCCAVRIERKEIIICLVIMYVRACMRRSGCSPGWSMELSAFAVRLFAPDVLDRLFRPILPRERA